MLFMLKMLKKIFSIYNELPKVNGGIVVMDPFTGRFSAKWCFSFKQSEFNRATQAKRQLDVPLNHLFMH